MGLQCWNCENELPEDAWACPQCDAIVDDALFGGKSPKKADVQEQEFIRPGQTFAGRYEVKKMIGRGGLGEVYLAWDTVMDRDVTLKVVPQKFAMDQNYIDTLNKEATIAQELINEHIVSLYDLDIWEGQVFVTMEYVEGPSLAQFVSEKGGKLTIEETHAVISQVAKALDYVHTREAPLTHRGLKLHNIRLTPEGWIKVADFGVARVLYDTDVIAMAKDFREMMPYLAPEQIINKGVGPWTDVYALSAVAYELLSGAPPFHTGDVRQRILQEAPSPIVGIPEHINKALMKGLAKQVGQRPLSAGAFAKQFEKPAEQPIKPKAPSAPPPAQKVPSAPSSTQAAKQPPKRPTPAADKPTAPAPKSSRQPRGKGISWFKWALGLLLLASLGIAGVFIHGALTKPPVIVVRTNPAVAEVFIDDQRVGLSPIQMDTTVGTHQIRIVKDGYEPHETSVFVQKGEPRMLQVELKPFRYGNVTIESKPIGALVFLDGEQKGVTPLTISKIDKGLRKIVIKHDGYEDWSGEVEIVPNQTASVSPQLLASWGSVFVTTKPKGATVKINGVRKGKSPITVKDLGKGTVNVAVSLSCYGGRSKVVQVMENQMTQVSFNLKPTCGALVVNSKPQGATWTLNGEEIGKTPGKKTGLKPGKYTVRASRGGDFPAWSKVVTIAAGETKTVNARFQKLSAGDEWREPLTGMMFVWVPSGCYKMGSPADEPGHEKDEGPLHKVCLSGFWMGKFEVTNAQYRMYKPSHTSKDYGQSLNEDNQPVVYVSWRDAGAYAKWLTRNSKSGGTFRLPSEAEWEYACRAGSQSIYFWGDEIDPTYLNFSDRNDPSGASRKDLNDGYAVTAPIGSFVGNAFNLYDMLGNVWEWCLDVYREDAYSKHKSKNPVITSGGTKRVLRGGSWGNDPSFVRAANRSSHSPGGKFYYLGIRLVKEP